MNTLKRLQSLCPWKNADVPRNKPGIFHEICIHREKKFHVNIYSQIMYKTKKKFCTLI